MEINVSGQYSITLNQILKQLRYKEITLDEYLMKCAYWGMKSLDDIYFMSLPSRSSSVRDYESLPRYKRDKLTDDFYNDNPEITQYYNRVNWVNLQNSTSLFKLESIKKYMPESDTVNHRKLDMKINDFKMKMEGF